MKISEIDDFIKQLEKYKSSINSEISLEKNETSEPNKEAVELHQKLNLISKQAALYRKKKSEEHYSKFKMDLPPHLDERKSPLET